MAFTNNVLTDQYSTSKSNAAMVYGQYKGENYNYVSNEAKAGTMVDSLPTVEAGFNAANALWHAKKVKGHYQNEVGEVVETDKFISLINSDSGEWLGNFSDRYEPVQNRTICDLVTDLVEKEIIEKPENILQMEGGKIYIQSPMNQGEVLDGDHIRQYLHICDSKNGSTSLQAFTSYSRLSCANALGYFTGSLSNNAIRSGHGIRLKHSKGVNRFASAISEVIDKASGRFDNDLANLRRLANVRSTEYIETVLFNTVFADRMKTPIRDKNSGELRDRRLNDIQEVNRIRSSIRNNTVIGGELTAGFSNPTENLYLLLNATTQELTHGKAANRRIKTHNRLRSLYHGSQGKAITTATECLLQFA
tara:strand:- start:361 stop:1449 length:1089 start_codon:yes stop_codon:yes gene_type:complete